VATHAAFLRGINLGKSRRVKNEALRDAFERLDLEGVATFRASGNVVFEAEPAKSLGARIEAGLAESLGIEVVVFLRTARQVRAVAAREPFSKKELAASAGKSQVALLPSRPAAAARREALAMASEEDRLAVEGAELHWLPRGGISDSDLDLKALESLLGPWTMRTMGTIEEIAARHCAAGG
jgi:uncharacterized protein (DUF1697 family)